MLYGVIFRRVWREESSVLLASRRWGVRRPLIKQAFVLAFLWEVCDRLNMALIDELIADLHAESASLDAIVADLPARDWATPTPAAGTLRLIASRLAQKATVNERKLPLGNATST